MKAAERLKLKKEAADLNLDNIIASEGIIRAIFWLMYIS